MQKHLLSRQLPRFLMGLVLTGCFLTGLNRSLKAQTVIGLENLDAFEKPGKTWSIAGGVDVDLEEKGVMTGTKGSGILVNIPTKKDKGQDLYTKETFGDMDLEVEYTVAKGSNSGIYLQGMYEIQILDSWGVRVPRAGDNGGIYERWDDAKPDGQKGYQGYAPRQNASKAPGLWQHLKVSFQAPRFDESGNKTENARILSAELNGVTIHENVELFGPTRGAMSGKEMAKGPLRIQGDHGAVAFRNLKIDSYDKKRPELADINYQVFEGTFDSEPDFGQLKPSKTGNLEVLSSDFRTETSRFLIRYQGKLLVHEPGDYRFGIQLPGGGGVLRINGEEAVSPSRSRRSEPVRLPAGEHAFELIYAKSQDWAPTAVGWTVSGPGIREFQLGNSAGAGRGTADPILVDPKERPLLRSFMDIPGHDRVTHALSVGSEAKVHYTYDMDYGHIVQVWRGEFLNATPMWNSRGDGSSRPEGAVVRFGKPSFTIGLLDSNDAPWVADTTGTAFRPLGYRIKSKENHVAFTYRLHNAVVEDDLLVLEEGQGLRRVLSIEGPKDKMYLRLAEAELIEDLGKGLYAVGDRSYYVQLNGNTGAASIRKVSGKQELLLPAGDKIEYTLLF